MVFLVKNWDKQTLNQQLRSESDEPVNCSREQPRWLKYRAHRAHNVELTGTITNRQQSPVSDLPTGLYHQQR